MDGKDLAKGFIGLLRDFSEELKQGIDVFRERFRHSEYLGNKAIAKFKEDGVWPKVWGVLCYIFYILYRIIHLLLYVPVFINCFILYFYFLAFKYYVLGWVTMLTFIAVNLPVILLAVVVNDTLNPRDNSVGKEIEQTEIGTLSEKIDELSGKIGRLLGEIDTPPKESEQSSLEGRVNILTGLASSMYIMNQKLETERDKLQADLDEQN